MSRVDLGDGGPPVDIPDEWMPDYLDRARNAIQRGRNLRRTLHVKHAILAGHWGDAFIADRYHVTEADVTRLRHRLGADPPTNTEELKAKILGYPVRDYDPPIDTLVDPEQWAHRRGRPRRIRIIVADPAVEDHELPEPGPPDPAHHQHHPH